MKSSGLTVDTTVFSWYNKKYRNGMNRTIPLCDKTNTFRLVWLMKKVKNVVDAMYPTRYFLTIKEVCDLFGRSRSTITRRERENRFPKRQKILGKKVGYRKDLIIQFLNDGLYLDGGI